MNATNTEQLRTKLLQEKAELSERLNKIKADVTGGLEADSKEQAAQLENQEVLDALANEATEQLQLITQALQRMEEGTYGTCIGCGTEIDSRRLEARPYAPHCIACAS